MSPLPSWAPNFHPLVVHFPIVLVIVAAVVDLIDVMFKRPGGLGAAASSLYVAAAVAVGATYVTGIQAASTVFVPGMAHPVVDAHREWALVTVWYCAAVAIVRLAARRGGPPLARSLRVLLLLAGLLGVVLLQQTAERGAQLVYQYGVGVIGAPGTR